jgi:hypothetical protein
MWLPNDVIAAVDDLARIYYVNVDDCKSWNANRREGELRLLTGWVWQAKRSLDGSIYQQGLKTKTQCYRDAYYRLVLKRSSPLSRAHLIRRVV